MKTNNKIYANIIALALVFTTIVGIANFPAIDTIPETEATGSGSVDYVNDPEATYGHEDGPAANDKTGWQDALNDADNARDKGSSNKKTSTKETYTYADGTTTKHFAEVVKADTNKKFAVTLVKSGVNNKMTGKTVHSNSYGTIDVTHANEGYVTLKLTKSTSKKVLGSVDYTDKDGKISYCDWYMDKDETYTIPTYFGDGKYTVSILENKSGTDYYVRLSVNITVKSNSELQTFLNSTRCANFADAPNTVVKAKELTANCKTDREKINVIYNWVYDNIKYDINKALDDTRTSQASTYDLDAILEARTGVCEDISVLMAGMLRSLGIPCKFVAVKGHAFISVWNETGTSTKNGVTYATGSWVELNSTARGYGPSYKTVEYYG